MIISFPFLSFVIFCWSFTIIIYLFCHWGCIDIFWTLLFFLPDLFFNLLTFLADQTDPSWLCCNHILSSLNEFDRSLYEVLANTSIGNSYLQIVIRRPTRWINMVGICIQAIFKFCSMSVLLAKHIAPATVIAMGVFFLIIPTLSGQKILRSSLISTFLTVCGKDPGPEDQLLVFSRLL